MSRLLCLDGLRGVLAVYVMLGHMAPYADWPAGTRWVAGLLSHGMAAVDMFFMLSGLVITRSLASFGQARAFLLARAARLYPVFLVVFALAIPVQLLPLPFAAMPWADAAGAAGAIWAHGLPADWGGHIALHLLMLHGLLPDGALPFAWGSFLGAAWSLSTEWQFYALAALLLAWRGEAARRLAPGFALAMLGLALAGALWGHVAPPGWRFSRAFLPNKAEYFALGIASAAVLEEGRAGLRRLALVSLAVLGICLLRGGGAEKLLPPLAWLLCLAVQALPSGRLRLPARLLASKALLWLGAVSYPLYLVNEPVQRALGVALAAAAGGSGALFSLLWVPGALALPLLLAAWLHRAVEVPFQRRGRERARRLAASPGAAQAASGTAGRSSLVSTGVPGPATR